MQNIEKEIQYEDLKKVKIRKISSRHKRKIFIKEIKKYNDVFLNVINCKEKQINPRVKKLMLDELDAMLLVDCTEEILQDKDNYSFKMREKDGSLGKLFVELYKIFNSQNLLERMEEFIYNNLAFKTGLEVAEHIKHFNVSKFEEFCLNNAPKITISICIDFAQKVKTSNQDLWENLVLNEFDWVSHIKYCNGVENANVKKFQDRLICEGNVFGVVQFSTRVPKADLVETGWFLLERNKLYQIPFFEFFAGPKVVKELVERVVDSNDLKLCMQVKENLELDDYQKTLIDFAIKTLRNEQMRQTREEKINHLKTKLNEIEKC